MPVLTATCRSARVRALNDAFRRIFTGGRVIATAGSAALPKSTCTAVLAAVRAFDRFDTDNDQHGERDFGALTLPVSGFLKC
jgi:hypothetical protein